MEMKGGLSGNCRVFKLFKGVFQAIVGDFGVERVS